MKAASVALGALLALLAVIAPGFYSASNLRDLLLNNAPALLVAVGMTAVILAGQIDISVASQFALVSVLSAVLAKLGVPVIALLVIAPLLGGALGAINGVLVSRLRIPAIVATLAAMAVLRESLRWATDGAWIQNLPSSFQWMGLGQAGGQTVILMVTAAVFAAVAWALRNLAGGRAVYATGSNFEAARLAGLFPDRVVMAVFVFCGGMTGLAAFLNSIRFSEIPSNAGAGIEMKAIAAAVVGGCAITGGRGSAAGTLAGAMLLGTIGTALTFLHVDAAWEKAIQGAIILAAIMAATARLPGGAHAAK
ncbi:MAG: ABC transporter permease [Bryobacteraceae bacterium]|nr:ABC transporter permease [Bryobacteraceae bacterium]